MSDTWVWTDELVADFQVWYNANKGRFEDHIREFKFLRTKPKVEWEIVSCLAADGKSLHPYQEKRCLGADKHLDPCTIHSVRRLSDGEVFSIGDSFEIYWPKYEVVKIDNFNINEGGGLFLNYTKDGKCGLNIKVAKKATKPIPLLVSEDGIEFFSRNENVFSVCSKGQWETDLLKVHYAMTRKEPWKHFSTKEKREEYILYNKPLLSLTDVHYGMFTQYCTKDEAYVHIKQLAKEKLSK